MKFVYGCFFFSFVCRYSVNIEVTGFATPSLLESNHSTSNYCLDHFRYFTCSQERTMGPLLGSKLWRFDDVNRFFH